MKTFIVVTPENDCIEKHNLLSDLFDTLRRGAWINIHIHTALATTTLLFLK